MFQEAGVEALNQPFLAKGDIATAGGCLASAYLAAWVIARVGGTFRLSFKNFSTGNGHSFGGECLELVPNELIRYTDKFDDPNLPRVSGACAPGQRSPVAPPRPSTHGSAW